MRKTGFVFFWIWVELYKVAYSNLKLLSPVLNKETTIVATVKNTGDRDGDEVIQLYIHQVGQTAVKELKGYQRVHLKKAESKQVVFSLSQRCFALQCCKRWLGCLEACGEAS